MTSCILQSSARMNVAYLKVASGMQGRAVVSLRLRSPRPAQSQRNAWRHSSVNDPRVISPRTIDLRPGVAVSSEMQVVLSARKKLV